MTTYQDLDAFADRIEAAPAWNFQMSVDLFNLIAPVALSLQGRTLKAPTLANCFDSILPWKPSGWKRLMGEVPRGAYAEFIKFQTANAADLGAVRVGCASTKTLCASTTLAVIAATARVWSYLLHPTQDWYANAPQGQVATV